MATQILAELIKW